ncbi:hypothetical protein [Clostridium baratii]|uniref:hypothetical protein n=1 Tax=Clostridium baratii TaxID=1561 RepID=UPI0029050927|nr:hypothetical protein [Clostridium baratii]MDU1055137.1 hypothetical protein [Clostridium baratii]MDU4912663.1 hypothetical protein [Clostridium baratii]
MVVEKTLSEALSELINQKDRIIMLEQFPFFIVGEVLEVYDECLIMRADFGVPVELLGKTFFISIDKIITFY